MSQSELNSILAMLQDFSWGNTPYEMRVRLGDGFSMPPHPTAQINSINADGVVAELISSRHGNPDHVLLYLHGGGFASGSCQTYRPIACDLAEASAAKVLFDALQLARNAGLANVAVELKVWRDMIHCFHLFAPMLEEARRAIAEAGAFLNRHWPSTTPPPVRAV